MTSPRGGWTNWAEGVRQRPDPATQPVSGRNISGLGSISLHPHHPVVTDATMNRSVGMASSSFQTMAIGRSPLWLR